MKISVLLFLLLGCSFFNYQIFAQSEEIEKIKITSSWTGLAPTLNSNLVIKQKKGKFYANGRKIETRLIAELLKQINIKEEQT